MVPIPLDLYIRLDLNSRLIYLNLLGVFEQECSIG